MRETSIQTRANQIARKAGFQKATEIVMIDAGTDHVVSRIPYGYRKATTGEYVTNAYRQHFGWKNTYYQHTVTVVALVK